MSCHLRECIHDYGPLNHFWLFAFERFNGILGQLPNNNRSIETQMMQHFLSDTNTMRVPMQNDYKDGFQPLLNFARRPVGTVGIDSLSSVDDAQLPHSAKRSVFSSSELEEIYQNLQRFTCPQLLQNIEL